MEMAGREWLWRNDRVPYRAPLDGASYGETADTGGYDECFPTVAPCHVPADVTVFGGLALPDHGELWAVRPAIEVSTPREGGATARTVWTGRRMPYQFTRTVRITSEGVVEMHYAVSNDGNARLPFIWSGQAMLPMTPKSRIILPAGLQVRVGAQHGIDVGGVGASHTWPRITAKERVIDLSVPEAAGRRYAVKLHAEAPDGGVAVEESGARLEVTFDPRQVPDLGIWINRKGWSGAAKRPAAMTIGLAPSIGAPDSLSDALGAGWNRAHWLERGETREWSLTWRGTA